jgi:uncharacterized protein YkwD
MVLDRRSFILLGAGAALSGCTGGIVPAGTTSPTQLSIAAMTAQVNSCRVANGCKPLTYNERLAEAARTQANLMAARDELSHSVGGKLRARVAAAGYDGAVGENLAGGQHTLEEAIQGWLNSSGHRSTLLNSKFTEFGLAAAQVPAGKKSKYGTYWAFIAGGSFDAWR